MSHSLKNPHARVLAAIGELDVFSQLGAIQPLVKETLEMQHVLRRRSKSILDSLRRQGVSVREISERSGLTARQIARILTREYPEKDEDVRE